MVKAWCGFVRKLKETVGQGGTLLNQTMVLVISCMGNTCAYDNKNMAVLFAGGGFRHGQHFAFDIENNYPLPNRYVSTLQRLGLAIAQFATSTLSGLKIV